MLAEYDAVPTDTPLRYAVNVPEDLTSATWFHWFRSKLADAVIKAVVSLPMYRFVVPVLVPKNRPRFPEPVLVSINVLNPVEDC